jgi:mono/diheme cytochrome c family protein
MRMFTRGLLTGFMVGPLVAAFIAVSGFWPVTGAVEPPAWETMMARRTLTASVARQAPKVQNPLSPSSEVLRAGMKVYRDGCSGCHGDYQKPSHWGTTAFYPRVPQFAKNAPDRPDWQMFWIVKHGVRYSGMAAWQGEIPDEKIWQVVTFLSRLRNLPPDVEADWTQPPVEKSR